jgi:hypothetical protein
MPGQARLDAPDTLYHVQDFEPGGEELVNLVNNVPLEHPNSAEPRARTR